MTSRFQSPVRTVAILRGYPPAAARELAFRCWESGIDLVEVPVQDDQAWHALDAVVGAAGQRPVGAGTVIDQSRARRAIDAGAEVLILPGLDEAVVEIARVAGVVVLPGAMTPTEIQACVRLGLDTCKMFPVSTLGTGYLRALRPVFPGVGFVATGGVGLGNAAEFVAAGAAALAFGGAIEAVLDNPATVGIASTITSPWLPAPPALRH